MSAEPAAPPTVGELLHRIDLNLLYPPFAQKLVVLTERCVQRGAYYYATNAMRTVDQQNALWAKGRTVPPIGEEHTVTRAIGGSSPHNFGIACDLCRDADIHKKGLQTDWDADSYVILAEEAVAIGLDAGLYWNLKGPGIKNDPPHVQLPTKKRGITWGKLRAAYGRGHYPAVFQLLDTKAPW